MSQQGIPIIAERPYFVLRIVVRLLICEHSEYWLDPLPIYNGKGVYLTVRQSDSLTEALDRPKN